ncbi:hypothetical protein [Jeotgalibacillus haloalkalitolerans]|uniref:Uncharacterized protein n=1 Tax=Jeotgalibacillus haloalkalitolerans TaxID=3104292 RepID=A0ABU5KNB4_9BACL|nr:hypothetical protein [Jeotgalibacillus sp. HH7-29]MDZ5712637.1 hypothetical protein [Jeotgalibacillus sp. HH7-29]
MILRKLIGVFVASLATMFFFAAWQYQTDPSNSFWGWFWFVGLYIIPFVLFYGMLVSLLSDILIGKFIHYPRMLSAFIFHLFFGVIFTFVIYLFHDTSFVQYWNEGGEIVMIGAVLSALVFWFVDELLRKVLDLEKIQRAM